MSVHEFICMIRLLWDCVTLDANSYPEVAFSRKELVISIR